MRIVLWSLVCVLALPVLLLIAIAIGPVILGILCAAGFALVVFAFVNGVVGLGLAGRRVERTAARFVRRGPGS